MLALVLGYPLVRLVVISGQDYGLRSLFTGTPTFAGLGQLRRRPATTPSSLPVLVRSIGFCARWSPARSSSGSASRCCCGALGPPACARPSRSCLIAAWALPNVASTLVWQWLFQPGLRRGQLAADPRCGSSATSPSTTGRRPRRRRSRWSGCWSCGSPCRSSRSPCTPACPRSRAPTTKPPRWTAPGRGGCSARSRCRSCGRSCGLVTILSVIWDFTVFNQIWILTQGGPGGGTTTLGIWSFTRAFSQQLLRPGRRDRRRLGRAAGRPDRLLRAAAGPFRGGPVTSAGSRRNTAAAVFCWCGSSRSTGWSSRRSSPAATSSPPRRSSCRSRSRLANFADALGKAGVPARPAQQRVVVRRGRRTVHRGRVSWPPTALTRFRFFGPPRLPRRRAGACRWCREPALVIPLFLGLKSVAPARHAPRADPDVRGARAAVHDLDAARLPARHPGRTGGGRDGRRRRPRPDHPHACCCRWCCPASIATSVFAFITAWNDFLFAYVMMKDQTELHAAGLAGLVQHQHRHRLRRPDRRLDAVRAAGGRLLPARAAPAGRRHDRRRRQGMSPRTAERPP